MKFNVFDVRVKPVFWLGYVILVGPKPSGVNQKSVKAAIKQLWLDGVVLAESTNVEKSWVLIDKHCHASKYDELRDFGYTFTPLEIVPTITLLSFYFTAFASSAGALSTFKQPSKAYWESSRKKDGAVVQCLYPEFIEFGDSVAFSISATTFRRSTPVDMSGLPKSVFGTLNTDQEFISYDYKVPSASDYLHEPVVRNARAKVPWMIDAYGIGTTGCKADFLQWMVSHIESKGVFEILPCTPDAISIKSLVGKIGAKANLTQKVLREHIRAVIGDRKVKIYDRRTSVDNHAPWPAIYAALAQQIANNNLVCVDMGALAYDASPDVCLVCIDRPDSFENQLDDTKPKAIAGFPVSVQCFTSEIFEEAGSLDDLGHGQLEVGKSTVLVLLSNEIIKSEIKAKQLLMPRVWNQKELSRFAFCLRFPDGDGFIYRSIHIDDGGRISFFEAPSSSKIAGQLKLAGLVPVFRVDSSDGKDGNYKPIDGTVEIISMPARAIPLPNKKGMTEHYSGVIVIPGWRAYYAGGSERPAKPKVDKALVIREIRSHNIDVDACDIATFCIDPAVKMEHATVWPAPFKLLAEYAQILEKFETAQ